MRVMVEAIPTPTIRTWHAAEPAQLQFSLPEHGRGPSLLASTVLHAAALLLVLSLGPVAMAPGRLRARIAPVFLASPPEAERLLTRPVARVVEIPVPVRRVLVSAKLTPPPPDATRVIQAPRLATPEQIPNTDALPHPELPPAPLARAPAVFADAGPAIVPKPVLEEVETARFDRPALPVAAAKQREASVAIGIFGTDDAGERRAAAREVVSNSGFGTVSTTARQDGYASAGVAGAGFDTAQGREARQAKHQVARTAIFDAVSAAPGGAEKQAVAAANRRPVEVLYKPRPAYTPDALSKKVEGVVLLEVVFEASGTLRVLRVVRGLGFGLDESAVEAARRVRFKPALDNSTPVDQRAILNIVFQLAG